MPPEPAKGSIGNAPPFSASQCFGPIGLSLPFAAQANATSESASFIADLLGPNSFFHSTREDEEEAALINQGVG